MASGARQHAEAGHLSLACRDSFTPAGACSGQQSIARRRVLGTLEVGMARRGGGGIWGLGENQAGPGKQVDLHPRPLPVPGPCWPPGSGCAPFPTPLPCPGHSPDGQGIEGLVSLAWPGTRSTRGSLGAGHPLPAGIQGAVRGREARVFLGLERGGRWAVPEKSLS